jgi:hypothetical protein
MSVMLTAVVFLAGCGSMKIRQILGNPARYDNKMVTVDGIVKNSAGFIVAGTYQIDDGTGTLRVITNTSTPPNGTPVKVTGRINSVGIVIGRNLGTVLQERDRKVK